MFNEFLIQKAVCVETDEEATEFFEKAMESNVANAFYELGKMILSHGYRGRIGTSRSLLTTGGKQRGSVAEEKKEEEGEALSDEDYIALGEKLMEKAHNLGCKQTTSYLVDYYYRNGNTAQAFQIAKSRSDPWSLFSLAWLYEKTGESKKAYETYLEATPYGVKSAYDLSWDEESKNRALQKQKAFAEELHQLVQTVLGIEE